MVLFPYLASLTDTNSEEWVCLGSPLLFPPWSIQSSTDNVNFYHLWVLFLWGNNNNSNKKWNQSRSCEKNLWRELWSSFTPAGYETHREKRAACDSKTMPKRKTFLPLLAKKSFRHRHSCLDHHVPTKFILSKQRHWFNFNFAKSWKTHWGVH